MQLINDLEKIMFKSPGWDKQRLGGTLWLKIWEGWTDSLGSGILIRKKIFWGFSKILIWTIVRG